MVAAQTCTRKGARERGADVRFGSKADMCSAKGMSALPPKADMCGATSHVRFVPIADILPFTRSPRRRARAATLER